jgi:hypothetical protein
MTTETERSVSNLNEYPRCLMCDEIPNPQRINALKADVTSYDNIPFDPKDPVIVSKTETYCLDALWSRTIFYK